MSAYISSPFFKYINVQKILRFAINSNFIVHRKKVLFKFYLVIKAFLKPYDKVETAKDALTDREEDGEWSNQRQGSLKVPSI